MFCFLNTSICLFLHPLSWKQRGILEGAVAQLVEQRTENPCVGGSIPPHTTKRTSFGWSFFFMTIFFEKL